MAEKILFQNEKFLGFEHPCNLLEYFQNKEIDSKKTLLKHQYTNGSSKEQQFLNRGSNKLSCSHWEKKEGTSMWNAWVFCVFLFDGNYFTPCSSFSMLTHTSFSMLTQLSELMPAGICGIPFHIYRNSNPEVFFKKSVLHLEILQENVHAEVWVQLYWNHISLWVFLCKYWTYLQESAFFREHIRGTSSIYRFYHRGYKSRGSS